MRSVAWAVLSRPPLSSSLWTAAPAAAPWGGPVARGAVVVGAREAAGRRAPRSRTGGRRRAGMRLLLPVVGAWPPPPVAAVVAGGTWLCVSVVGVMRWEGRRVSGVRHLASPGALCGAWRMPHLLQLQPTRQRADHVVVLVRPVLTPTHRFGWGVRPCPTKGLIRTPRVDSEQRIGIECSARMAWGCRNPWEYPFIPTTS